MIGFDPAPAVAAVRCRSPGARAAFHRVYRAGDRDRTDAADRLRARDPQRARRHRRIRERGGCQRLLQAGTRWNRRSSWPAMRASAKASRGGAHQRGRRAEILPRPERIRRRAGRARQQSPAPCARHPAAARCRQPGTDGIAARTWPHGPRWNLSQVDSEWVQRLNAILDLLRRLVLALGAAGPRRAGSHRQHHPARDLQSARRDRGHQAGRRQQCLRAPAVPLHRASTDWGALLAARWSRWRWPAGRTGRPAGDQLRQRLRPAGSGPREWRALLGIGMFLGWLGAWLAAARHLARIEPRADISTCIKVFIVTL